MGVADNPEERAALYKKLSKEIERNSLMAASIPVCKSVYIRYSPLFIKVTVSSQEMSGDVYMY
jgi:hypothetical protein